MPRKLSPRSTLDSVKKEARRWLNALRDNDAASRVRFERLVPDAPADPSLRHVQHALALEYGFDGWRALKAALGDRPNSPRDDRVTALLDAAARGDATRIAALLDEAPDIASERGLLQGHSGVRTALHHAVGGGHLPIVRLLLDRGADPNVRDEGDNAMPLHFAAEKDRLGMIILLIEHGADPIGSGDFHELEVIGWATVFGSARSDVVDYLVAHGARHNILSAVATGNVAAIRAVAAERPEEVDRVMDGTNHRRRPLHLAIVKRQPASLDALLALGADTSTVDAAGLTPLDQAALNGEGVMVERLLEAGATVGLPAAIVLDRDVDRTLAAAPGALHPGGRWGTLIIRAAEQSPAHVIEALIRHGASVNVIDDETTAVDSTAGYTPLHAAAFRGNVDAVRALLAHGASVVARDSRYCGTAAGWANYARHTSVRDLILQGPIDMFDAISFDLVDRLRGIFDRDPSTLNRRMREYLLREPGPDEWTKSWWTPLAFAVVNNKPEAVRVLLELGAETAVSDPEGRTLADIARANGTPAIAALLEQFAPENRQPATDQPGRESRAEVVARFLLNACPDHHVRGGASHIVARATAQRLLERHPELARDSLYTAVVCGDIEYVERTLADHPAAARQKGGPKGSAGARGQQFVVDGRTAAHPRWEPLLYACFARLDHGPTNDNAVAIVRALLDHGADPNAYFMAGDSRYSPLTGVVGEGEEARLPHPRRDALARLLLERGAHPYDMQVLYNIHFSGRMLWFLKLIHEVTVQRGRESDWDDPNWSMLDMGGYGCGARYTLWIAVENNDVELAEWALTHGASPNAPRARAKHYPKMDLHEAAIRNGFAEMASLLLKYGAKRSDAALDVEHDLLAACLRLDRPKVEALFARHPALRTSHVALHAAAGLDRADVVSLLIELGVSPSVENPTGGHERPLHVTAYSEAPNAAVRLIEAGAEVDSREQNYGATALELAIWGQHTRMIELLSRFSSDPWNLAFVGAVDRLRAVLAAEPRLATVVWPDEGITPLMRLPGEEATAMEVAKLLIAHGADPARRSKAGDTADDIAEKRGLAAVAAYLRTAST